MVVDEYAAIAPVYDLWSAGMTDDLPFYVREARDAGGPVLEIGVGTGRVALAIARIGVDVVGIDVSPSMLAIARQRFEREGLLDKVELREGDMRALDLGDRRFPIVMLPYRVLAHALTPDELLETLRHVREHLTPGGRLVFNLPVPGGEDLAGGMGLRRDGRFEMDDGTEAVVLRSSEYQPGTQQIRFDFIVDHLDQAGTVVRRVHSEMVVRQNSPGEIEHALALAGFQLVDRWGWFDGRPFGADSIEMVFGATRREGWRR